MNRLKISIAMLLLVGGATAALAQRDPAYQAARAAGEVGEQPDGYLGVVGSASPAVRALVNNINIQRKAAYTQQSAASGATVEQFAFTSGCNLILKTAPGEKYKGPDGVWKTRTAAPPERDSRCI
ncbi:YdbL family protein [Sphingomonas echinoides]|uniref:YdbL family protein n=1 Tax=Sphingomonas echinoides TaxID=59803 RepID=A0ABU4PGB1_9SPHN|nr:YdbL family protein [Sphingomonas echinoides]MDX5983256.1 YdbL family protein [Sphingomonas echinoides]